MRKSQFLQTMTIGWTNNEDFIEYFRALRKVHYKGMISVECNWQNMEEQVPLAIKTIRTQMEG